MKSTVSGLQSTVGVCPRPSGSHSESALDGRPQTVDRGPVLMA
jgi:hypothetical protein